MSPSDTASAAVAVPTVVTVAAARPMAAASESTQSAGTFDEGGPHLTLTRTLCRMRGADPGRADAQWWHGNHAV